MIKISTRLKVVLAIGACMLAASHAWADRDKGPKAGKEDVVGVSGKKDAGIRSTDDDLLDTDEKEKSKPESKAKKKVAKTAGAAVVGGVAAGKVKSVIKGD